MTPPALEVRGLGYAYPDGTRALIDVSFAVGPGESVAIVGGNGAGKSTLLLLLAGGLRPGSGEVRIGGAAAPRAAMDRARLPVGLVFQDPDDQLFMPTVEEDVAFGPLNAGLAPDAVERRVAAALDRVGMAHARARPPYRLSAGEKRAAAIAAVLAMAPEVLVMDEPSSHLDPRARRRLIGLLQSFEHTRIVATHDLDLVAEVCSRVLVLDGGRVVADGRACEVLNDEGLMRDHGLERPRFPAPAGPR